MKYGTLVPVKLGYMYLSNQASGNDDYTCQFATRIMKRGSCYTKVGITLQLFLFTVLFSLPTCT